MKAKRTFRHIANTTRVLRVNCRLSQDALASLLGWKNAQYVSNIERALCSVPMESVGKLSHIFGVDTEVIVTSILKDYRESIEAHISLYGEEDKAAPPLNEQTLTNAYQALV
jgi:transcriptional regulator with XRE-family HTH domain